MVDEDPPPWTDGRVRAIDRPRADRLAWANLGRPGGLASVRELVASMSDVDAIPPVDERTVNPVGFLSAPTLGRGELSQAGDRWSIRCAGIEPVRFHPSGQVTEADVARLRSLRAVSITWGRHTGPVAAVRTVAGLAAAGIPVFSGPVPEWAAALGGELTDVLTAPPALDDDLDRHVYSIRLRRAALRTHSSEARWRNLAVAAGLPAPAPPKVSVLLCTRRPDYLGSAIPQIARQRHVDLELILTLHGLPAAAAGLPAVLEDFPFPSTVVEVPADVPFGEALNRGAARASGRYLAKWDDDDWYGPDHLGDLLLAAGFSGAELVGCAYQMTYLEQINLTVYHPGGETERYNRHVAGCAFMVERRTFAEVGGFRPVGRAVDTWLLRAVTAAGGLRYRTHGLGYVVGRRATGHTWTMPITEFLGAKMKRQWRGLRLGPLVDSHARRLDPVVEGAAPAGPGWPPKVA
jgi:hypothetical protein